MLRYVHVPVMTLLLPVGSPLTHLIHELMFLHLSVSLHCHHFIQGLKELPEDHQHVELRTFSDTCHETDHVEQTVVERTFTRVLCNVEVLVLCMSFSILFYFMHYSETDHSV